MSLTLKAHFSTRFGFSISRALIYSIVLPYSLGPGMLLVLFIAPWQSERTLSLRFLSCHLYEAASPHASSLHICGVERVYLCFFSKPKSRRATLLTSQDRITQTEMHPNFALSDPRLKFRSKARNPPPHKHTHHHHQHQHQKKKPHSATTVNTPRDTSPPRQHPPAVPVCPNLCGQLYKFTHTALELECDAMM